jgi:hypothetical protein
LDTINQVFGARDDCPTGKSIYVNPKTIAFVKPSREKYCSSVFRKIMRMIRASRLGKRGVRPIVTKRGARDAMDAGVSHDERYPADGEIVQA